LSTAPITTEKLRYIDSLRGVAILLVIISHSHPYFAGIADIRLPEYIEHVLQSCENGVTLFFLMSAFTLCLSFNRKKQIELNPVRNYFIRRLFRIAPLYYFMILLILLCNINLPSNYSIVANLLFLHGVSPFWTNSTVPGGWSVGIEVLFYLIFPLLFFRIKSIHSSINFTLISIILSKIVTSIMFKNPPIHDGVLWGVYVYENFISQLPVFLMGICLFHIKHAKEDTIHVLSLHKCFLFIALLIVFHLAGGNTLKQHYLFAIAFAFAAYSLSYFQTKLIVNNLTVWVGKLSYSIYLLHLLVANLLVKYNLNHYSDNPVLEIAIRFFILFLISFVLSYLTYRVIELPFQEYGKKLISKLEVRSELLSKNLS
jgi:peptidoglycan/LPS O-acetylase OafA/YrhL